MTRDSWQIRALAAATGRFAAVLISMLALEHGPFLRTMLRMAFPGFVDLVRPIIVSGATITKTGRLVVDMIGKDGRQVRYPVYEREEDLIGEFRQIADDLKLTDADRVAMTECVKRWVVADLRVNHLGEKVVA